MKKFLFMHILDGIHICIYSSSLEAAKGVLDKLVKDSKQWTPYK